MHNHKFDTVIWHVEQQRITKHSAALSEDQDFEIVVQGLVVRRCECGQTEAEKYERPADPESTVRT